MAFPKKGGKGGGMKKVAGPAGAGPAKPKINTGVSFEGPGTQLHGIAKGSK